MASIIGGDKSIVETSGGISGAGAGGGLGLNAPGAGGIHFHGHCTVTLGWS